MSNSNVSIDKNITETTFDSSTLFNCRATRGRRRKCQIIKICFTVYLFAVESLILGTNKLLKTWVCNEGINVN